MADRSEYRTCGTFTTTDPYPDIAVNLLAILAVIAGILIGLIGLMVLCLATWMHSPGYNVGMVSLYAAWVVILWGAAAVLLECVSKAEQIYNQDAQSQTLK